MSRKHYESLVALLYFHKAFFKSEKRFKLFLVRFCEILKEDNPRFNEEKFIAEIFRCPIDEPPEQQHII